MRKLNFVPCKIKKLQKLTVISGISDISVPWAGIARICSTAKAFSLPFSHLFSETDKIRMPGNLEKVRRQWESNLASLWVELTLVNTWPLPLLDFSQTMFKMIFSASTHEAPFNSFGSRANRSAKIFWNNFRISRTVLRPLDSGSGKDDAENPQSPQTPSGRKFSVVSRLRSRRKRRRVVVRMSGREVWSQR